MAFLGTKGILHCEQGLLCYLSLIISNCYYSHQVINQNIDSNFNETVVVTNSKQRRKGKGRSLLMVFKNVSKLFLINYFVLSMLKPGFHVSRKSQTIGDFMFCQASQSLPIYRIFARGLSQIFPIMNLAGNGKCFDSVDQVVH